MRSFAALAAVLLLLLALPAAHAAPTQITSLPDLNTPLPSALYMGYITVNQTAGRAIFYAFAESQNNPATDPLVIWFTGGPGCSGFIALFNENGLFSMNFTSGAPVINPYSWNTRANMIYVESPAGVGFSYSNTSSDYLTVGDLRTAGDMYAFLQGFYLDFPQFAKNDFWVTGESYGGHYVPEFAYYTLEMNAALPAGAQFVPLKGIMAGNPWTAPNIEAFGVTDNWWYRGMISRAVHNDIDSYCTYTDITFWIINNVTLGGRVKWEEKYQRLMARKGALTANQTICFDALYQGSITQFGGVDILGVYLDVCNAGTVGDIPDQPNYCADNQLVVYLNRLDVQQTIGIANPPVVWGECSNTVNHAYNAEDTQTSVLYAYEYFLNATDIAVLVYSGDNDAIVPTTGTRRWIEHLGRPIVNDTHQWWVDTNGRQVGGWAIQYDRMTFTTVRGAGHMVPYMQPQRALFMFNSFLTNQVL